MVLANETRTYRTSRWKRCVVYGVVENDQAFVLGIKGRHNTDQFEAAARALVIFKEILVGRRIMLGWLALDNCDVRSWLPGND